MTPMSERPWNPASATVRTFKSPRLFNVLFSYEDLQGDGFIRLTVGVLYRSVQLIVPFENKARRHFEWSLFQKTVVGAGHDG